MIECRRSTGSAFKSLAGIERDKLSLVQGEDLILKYRDDGGHDAHCGACGSLLYTLVREGRCVHGAMRTLVDAPTIRPAVHIFVGSKSPMSRGLMSSPVAESRERSLTLGVGAPSMASRAAMR
jgi:hypothetical protein